MMSTTRARLVRCEDASSAICRRQNLSGQWAFVTDKGFVGWFDEAVVGESQQQEADDRVVRTVLSAGAGDASIVVTGPSKAGRCVLWLVERAFESLCFSSVFAGSEWSCSCYETTTTDGDGGKRDLLLGESVVGEGQLRETLVAKNVDGSRRVVGALSTAWRRRRKLSAAMCVVVVKIKLGRRRRHVSFVDAPRYHAAKTLFPAATVLVYVSPEELHSLDEALRAEADRVELTEIEKENAELRETCKELETKRLAQLDLLDAVFLVQSDAHAASQATAAALSAERDRLSLARQDLETELADLYERFTAIENRPVQARKLDRSRQSLAANGFDVDDEEDEESSGDEHFEGEDNDSSGDEHFAADAYGDADENRDVENSRGAASDDLGSSRGRRRRTLIEVNALAEYEAACDSPPPPQKTSVYRHSADGGVRSCLPPTAVSASRAAFGRPAARSLRASLESLLLKLPGK